MRYTRHCLVPKLSGNFWTRLIVENTVAVIDDRGRPGISDSRLWRHRRTLGFNLARRCDRALAHSVSPDRKRNE